MILVLCYKIGDEIHQFSSKMHLSEYYITNNYKEFGIFVKGNELPITEEEYSTLRDNDFTICLSNGVDLFTKTDLIISNSRIKF